jgi:hypothetical protein
MTTQPSINAIIEMTALFTHRPAPGASNEAVAEWYRAKGRMHEQVAARGGEDAAQESAHAATSFAHARRLTAEGGWAA